MSQPSSLAPRHLARRGCSGEADVFAADGDRPLAVDFERRGPAAVDAVELEEMRGGSGPALDFVDVGNIETVRYTRVSLRACDRAERSPEREAFHAPHAVDPPASLPPRLQICCCRRVRPSAP